MGCFLNSETRLTPGAAVSSRRVPAMCRALITGVNGFVGRHLAEYLVERKWAVHGLVRGDCSGTALSGVQCHRGDVLDCASLERVLAAIQPTHIFHLAGAIGAGGLAPAYEVNIAGTERLFRAVRETRSAARVLVSSSSAVYGEPLTLPIVEDSPFKPVNEYGASKAAQEVVVMRNQKRGANAVRVRPFNLVGPGQSATLVTSDIAGQIVQSERAGQGVIRVGNTMAKRDYTDVRDAVRAYVAVAESALDDVYNVCSGHSTSTQKCLDTLTSMSSVPVTVEVDGARIRSEDIKEQVGSATRIETATGWRPRIALEASLADLLEEYRSHPARVP
jgi:GDP-4-dehydro-6-deoxy-D-mannose reductase